MLARRDIDTTTASHCTALDGAHTTSQQLKSTPICADVTTDFNYGLSHHSATHFSRCRHTWMPPCHASPQQKPKGQHNGYRYAMEYHGK
jgi:hypothetical protein